MVEEAEAANKSRCHAGPVLAGADAATRRRHCHEGASQVVGSRCCLLRQIKSADSEACSVVYTKFMALALNKGNYLLMVVHLYLQSAHSVLPISSMIYYSTYETTMSGYIEVCGCIYFTNHSCNGSKVPRFLYTLFSFKNLDSMGNRPELLDYRYNRGFTGIPYPIRVREQKLYSSLNN